MGSQHQVSKRSLTSRFVALGMSILTLGMTACSGPVSRRPWASGTVYESNDGTPPVLITKKGPGDFRGGAAHGVAPDMSGAMWQGYAEARDSFHSYDSYNRYAATLCKSGEFLGADGYVHDILTPCVNVRAYDPYYGGWGYGRWGGGYSGSPIRVYGYGGGEATKSFKAHWYHPDNIWKGRASGRIWHSNRSNDFGWPK